MAPITMLAHLAAMILIGAEPARIDHGTTRSIHHLMKNFIRLLLALVLLPTVAQALSPEETAAVKRAEDYMNALGNLRARFLQVNPDGSTHEGNLYVARPGKMRINYDPPAEMLVVADGKWLIYVDKEVDETSYLDLDDTPAGLLLKADISFTDKAVKLQGVRLGKNTVEITAAQAKDPAAGKLTFVFSDAPFELRQWRVLDAQNQEVSVTLFEPRFGGVLDNKLFEHEQPKDTRDPDRRGD
ncbi:MAG: outer membrane lipoprotein carrier protein LolA [Rhodospirillaceae bacterium]|nr:outer membrane lipoprotein carrier protein LolA [Rhodospirillaceae bacterium]